MPNDVPITTPAALRRSPSFRVRATGDPVEDGQHTPAMIDHPAMVRSLAVARSATRSGRAAVAAWRL
jgi:hypothetical protein